MDKIHPVITIMAVLILLYILWCLIEPFFFELDRAELKKSSSDKDPGITIKKLPLNSGNIKDSPDLRFFFFSDIHAEWCPVTAKRLCNAIRGSHDKSTIDAVIFGGDIVTNVNSERSGLRYLSTVSECCNELGIPFFGVSGNHDSCFSSIPEHAGFTSLDNRSISMASHVTGKDIVITGLPDSGRKNRVWQTKMQCENTEPVILVVHDPDAIIHLDPDSRPDYMLSGHLHGGQMKFPFRIEFTLLKRSDKLPQMGVVQGCYDISGTTVFISRGIGCGVFPFRFLSVPEATVTEIYL